jgi:hypothetical protein
MSAILLAADALGAQSRRPVPEVYSSLELIEESGDVVGSEVLVFRTAAGACVSYQLAEGAPEPLRIVPAIVRGDSLLFTIPPDSAYAGGTRRLVEVGPARRFRGRLTAAGLRAQIEGDAEPTWLPRRRRAYFPASARQLSNVALQPTCSPAQRAPAQRADAPAARGGRSGPGRPDVHAAELGRQPATRT